MFRFQKDNYGGLALCTSYPVPLFAERNDSQVSLRDFERTTRFAADEISSIGCLGTAPFEGRLDQPTNFLSPDDMATHAHMG